MFIYTLVLQAVPIKMNHCPLQLSVMSTINCESEKQRCGNVEQVSECAGVMIDSW